MSLIEVVAAEVERLGIEVETEPFVRALVLGYSLGRRVSETPSLLQDDERLRKVVRTHLEHGVVGCRPPLSERPLAKARS